MNMEIKRFLNVSVMLLMCVFVGTFLESCKKESASPAVVTSDADANIFKLDEVTLKVSATDISQSTGYVGATYLVEGYSSATSNTRVGMFFKLKPTSSKTYKIKHTYPASGLAEDEMFIDVNFEGCNYVSDSGGTVDVTVSGSKVNVKFSNIPYHFNQYLIIGATPRNPGKFTGNLNIN